MVGVLPRVIVVLVVVGLFAASGVQAASPTWSGRWRVTGMPATGGDTMTLVQKGTVVIGKVPWQIFSDKGFGGGYCKSATGGAVRGTVRGRVLTGSITFPARGKLTQSVLTFKATLARNGRAFEGRGQLVKGDCSDYGVFPYFTAVRIR